MSRFLLVLLAAVLFFGCGIDSVDSSSSMATVTSEPPTPDSGACHNGDCPHYPVCEKFNDFYDSCVAKRKPGEEYKCDKFKDMHARCANQCALTPRNPGCQL